MAYVLAGTSEKNTDIIVMNASMLNPDTIQTQAVCDAAWVYKEFHGTPEWPAKAKELQAIIDASGLSIPIPVIDLKAVKLDIPGGNPLTLAKPFFKQLRYEKNLDARSREIAQALYRLGLPVFYCDHSWMIDLTLNHQGQAVDDIAFYAPTLVYCHNYDRRGEGISRAMQRLYSRRSGICYLVAEKERI
jgi:hypothetical protein